VRLFPIVRDAQRLARQRELDGNHHQEFLPGPVPGNSARRATGAWAVGREPWVARIFALGPVAPQVRLLRRRALLAACAQTYRNRSRFSGSAGLERMSRRQFKRRNAHGELYDHHQGNPQLQHGRAKDGYLQPGSDLAGEGDIG
jgi:hypothetical protein